MNSTTITRYIGTIFGAFSLFSLSACSVIASGDEDANNVEIPTAKEAVAKVSMTPSAIHWQPRISYAGIYLTISGPVGVSTTKFPKGIRPSLNIKDKNKVMADGLYKYELRVSPEIDDKTRKKLAKARESGDESIVAKLRRSGALPKVPLQQSGHFRIVNGSIFIDTSNGREPRPQSGSK